MVCCATRRHPRKSAGKATPLDGRNGGEGGRDQRPVWYNAVEGVFAKLTRRRLQRPVSIARRPPGRHQAFPRRDNDSPKPRMDRRQT
jgi:hypothetical protein